MFVPRRDVAEGALPDVCMFRGGVGGVLDSCDVADACTINV